MRSFTIYRYIILIFSFIFAICCNLLAQKPFGTMDAEQRLNWYQQHVKMKETSLFKNLKWSFIGPEIMSGRVTDIAVPKGKKHTFFIATASGGVWKTENEGTTWESVLEHAPSTSVGAIAIANTNTNIIWVGLGESNIFRSSMSGTGMYKSIDGGKTWLHMGLSDSQHIGRIIINPTDPNIVYVAACGHEYTYNEERGVYKTIDGGKSWQKVLYINEKTGIIDIAMDPSDANILYASAWDRIRRAWNDPKPGENDAIYKTTDGGVTWAKIIKGLPDMNKVGRMGIAIAHSNPNVVYLLMDNHHSKREPKKDELDAYGRPQKAVITGAQVYRSDDKGENWHKVSSSKEDEDIGWIFSTYGWVFGQIRVDPNDENIVYIMGVPLMKSTDGGKTFKELEYRGLHADHHAMWINPENSNYIINGNDGGINISYDGGNTWKNFYGPGVVQFYNVTFDMAEPFNVYGSIQDNFSYRGPITHRPGIDPEWEWESIPGGEASYHAIDPSNENILYSEGFYGRIQISEFKDGKWDTKKITPKAKEDEPRLRGQWLAPFIISPHNPQIIYHGMQYVFRSLNRGDTWEKISPDLSYNDKDKQGDISFATITSLSESPFKFGLIYAGTDDGKVHVTKDGGLHWQEIMEGLPQRKWVSRIVASAYDESTVYLSQNGKRDDDFEDYLFKSTDNGNTWQDISSNIPGGPINVIKEDPHNKDILYAGTDLGVYVTIDGGKKWQVLANNIPTTFVHDVIIHPRDNILVAATHGRGMFTMDVSFIQKLDAKILNQSGHLFNIDTARLPRSKTRWDKDSAKFAKICYYLRDSKEVSIRIFNKSDDVIKKLQGSGDIGLNLIEWDLTSDEKNENKSELNYVEAGVYKIEIKGSKINLEGKIEVLNYDKE